MYNVRIVEYADGYQVRLYDSYMGVKEDENVKKCVKSGKFGCSPDQWYSADFSFEEIDEIEEWRRDEYLRTSLLRTRNSIYYLSRSNVWSWFVTLTLDPEKINRYDFADCSKKVRKWFNNLRRVSPDLYYLVVPEQHKDGAWHFHGLLGDCGGLVFSDSGKRDKSGRVIYNLFNWKYGFSTATEITDTARASSYICKYITKEICAVVPGRQRYWVSNNLERGKIHEALVPWMDVKEFREGLFDHCTYKKKVNTEFFDVEYFEVSKDWVSSHVNLEGGS